MRSCARRLGCSIPILQPGRGRSTGILLSPDSVWLPAGLGLPQVRGGDRERSQPAPGAPQLPQVDAGRQSLAAEHQRRWTSQRLDLHRVSLVPRQRRWQSSPSTAPEEPHRFGTLRSTAFVPSHHHQLPAALRRLQNAPSSSSSAQPQGGENPSRNQPATTARAEPPAPKWHPVPAFRPSQARLQRGRQDKCSSFDFPCKHNHCGWSASATVFGLPYPTPE